MLVVGHIVTGPEPFGTIESIMARRKRSKKIPLPQLKTPAPRSSKSAKGGCGSVRPSTRGKWRALSLFLVHVAIALHIAHWWATGKTVTPVEPSEAMQTLGREALVNAGFVFFALAILSTLIFGRFFCGWGCHLVAYQDLCTWILKKVGIKPQPFRSRLLIFVPLAAAIFMFVLPTVTRLIMGVDRDPYTSHFTTYDFWERFPGWVVGSLTIFVCGFAIVYLLGNKGFCTYACPYGGFFGLADQVTPGKIRVTDACERCGHCTAACTSNVRVHEEVHLHGMVINPGCMKCLDCISVCPKDALYFGYGKPAVTAKKQDTSKPKRYDFTWAEEIGLALLFLASVAILRKLYDGVPFLLALALASISAYVLLTAARFLYARHLRFARFTLRSGGRITRSGLVFATVAAVWALFLGHSAVVQYFTIRGQMEISEARQSSGASTVSAPHIARAHLNRGIGYLERADAWGLVPVANVLFDLGTAYAGREEMEKAKATLTRAVTFAPRFAAARHQLATLLMEEGALENAEAQLREVVRVAPEFPKAHSDLANLLIGQGRADEAASMLEELITRRPDVVEFHLAWGLALAHAGEIDRATEVMRDTADRWPSHPDAHYNLGTTLATRDDYEPALAALEKAAELNPDSGMIHTTLAQTAERFGQLDRAEKHFRKARDLHPFHSAYVKTWVIAIARRGELDQEIRKAEGASFRSREARYRLIYLYGAAGRTDEAGRMAAEFRDMNETGS